MKITTVTYGRTIEVGRFGKGRSGKVWFGWSAEVEADETPEMVLRDLQIKADKQEIEEHQDFEDRRDGVL